ncbi:PhzF family phenazine biosynthesis protein [Gammaproteobacteria bacterium]|nr:PhzF family phenazine biosynthesis protein [Gammaproteobacteria bacterium]
MNIPIFYLDAFTDKLFSGNPAAVIFSNINDSVLMQKIAAENNLSETAFIREEGGIYYIRWFAPFCEIDLCGHATLAAAFVYFNFINKSSTTFEVNSTKNGVLKVYKDNDSLYLDFPKDSISPLNESLIEKVIGYKPIELYQGRDDILAITEYEKMVRNLNIDFDLLKNINVRGLIVSSQGSDCDFVSRCFFPGAGVNEDPVTGSAHTTLTPYWSKKLNKTSLIAMQLSERGGVLSCEDKGERVIIGGKVTLYMKGEIYV